MATQVSMPDGTVLNFPDGVPEEEMRQAAESYHSQANRPAAIPSTALGNAVRSVTNLLGDNSKTESAARGYVQGGSLGYGDEIQGGIAAGVAKAFGGDATKGVSLGDLYREGRDNIRAENAAAEKANPKTYIGSQIASGLLTPMPKGQMVQSRLADAVIKGGLFGGAYGGGTSNADLTKGEVGEFAKDTAIGVGLGAGAGAAVTGLAKAGAVATRPIEKAYNRMRMTPDERAIDYVRTVLTKEGVKPQAIADRIKNASETGIPLTVPEATDSLKLMNTQRLIAKDTNNGSKIIRDYDAERFTDTIPKAVQNAIRNISPNTSMDRAGSGAADAANGAVKAATKSQIAAAKPLYNEAFKSSLSKSEFEKLLENPVLRKAIDNVKGDVRYRAEMPEILSGTALRPTSSRTIASSPALVERVAENPYTSQTVERVVSPAGSSYKVSSGGGAAEPYGYTKPDLIHGNQTVLPEANLKFLDLVKRNLDDQIESSLRTGEGNASRLLTGHKAALVDKLDTVNPIYAQARATWGNDAKSIQKITDDTIGKLQDLNAGNFETAIPKIFNDTAEGIGRSRAVITSQNPQAWDDVLASQMQNNLDKIRDGGFRNFYNNVYGNSLVRQKYQAAMSPEQYKGFSNLMEGLKGSLKVNLSGSDTHFNQISQLEHNQELGSQAAQAMKAWYNIPGKVADFFDERAIKNNSEALAKLFTSPNLGTLAKDLQNITPKSAEYYSTIGKFIATESPALIAPATAPAYQTKTQ